MSWIGGAANSAMQIGNIFVQRHRTEEEKAALRNQLAAQQWGLEQATRGGQGLDRVQSIYGEAASPSREARLAWNTREMAPALQQADQARQGFMQQAPRSGAAAAGFNPWIKQDILTQGMQAAAAEGRQGLFTIAQARLNAGATMFTAGKGVLEHEESRRARLGSAMQSAGQSFTPGGGGGGGGGQGLWGQ